MFLLTACGGDSGNNESEPEYDPLSVWMYEDLPECNKSLEDTLKSPTKISPWMKMTKTTLARKYATGYRTRATSFLYQPSHMIPKCLHIPVSTLLNMSLSITVATIQSFYPRRSTTVAPSVA